MVDPAVRINEIRAKARRALKAEPSVVCPTCGKPATSPFRVIQDGVIVHGCVDAYHHEHIVHSSESARWYYRPAAVNIRATELKTLTSRKKRARG